MAVVFDLPVPLLAFVVVAVPLLSGFRRAQDGGNARTALLSRYALMALSGIAIARLLPRLLPAAPGAGLPGAMTVALWFAGGALAVLGTGAFLGAAIAPQPAER